MTEYNWLFIITTKESQPNYARLNILERFRFLRESIEKDSQHGLYNIGCEIINSPKELGILSELPVGLCKGTTYLDPNVKEKAEKLGIKTTRSFFHRKGTDEEYVREWASFLHLDLPKYEREGERIIERAERYKEHGGELLRRLEEELKEKHL